MGRDPKTDPSTARFTTTKRTTLVWTKRAPAAAERVSLPACRAWRIVPLSAMQFAAGASPAITQAPAAAVDGALPVWVRATDERGGAIPDALLLVTDSGWNLSPMGPGWYIERASSQGGASDLAGFAVETVDDTAECGQVATPGPRGRRVLYYSGAGFAGTINSGPLNTEGLDILAVIVRNRDAAGSRVLTFDAMDDAGVNVLWTSQAVLTVVSSASGGAMVGKGQQGTGAFFATTVDGLQNQLTVLESMPLPKFIRFNFQQLAAGNLGSMLVWGA